MARFPVSVKGVILDDEGRVVLLKNERDAWELPGGKLEPGEQPADCLVREVAEEVGLTVSAGPLLDVWLFEVLPGREVLIVTYGCDARSLEGLSHSHEHRAVGVFSPDEVRALPMPQGYRDSIARWLHQRDRGT